MSDEVQDETTAAAQDAVEVEEQDTGEVDWKREARKWEKRARQNKVDADAGKDALKRIAEIEDAEKSETQRLQEQLEKVTAERDDAVSWRAKITVGAEFGMSPDMAVKLLNGSDEAALREQAELFSEYRAANVPRPEAPNQGRGGRSNDAAEAKSWATEFLKSR